jgi:RHS repeat-associated protein
LVIRRRRPASVGKWQGHDGDGLRVKDVQGSNTIYYLRSSVLGGKVVAEITSSGTWMRGYVYAGEQMVAVQNAGNYFVHQDPITKSQRITNSSGAVVEGIELDPFGGETNRSWGSQYQKQRYTTWERDWTGDESLFRRYHGWWSRFAHPDPYDGSYNLGDPQSFNRYAYVQNDPVNFIDPSGLLPCAEGEYGAWCGGGGYWGPRGFSSNGWGSEPRPGRTIIRDAEPLTIRFGINRWEDILFIIREPSMFGGWDWSWAGFQQQPRPTKSPLPPQPNRNQQGEFDSCAKSAWRQYRKTYLKTSGKAIGGGIGLGIGLSVMRGAPVAAAVGWRSVGFGFRGAMHSLGDKALTPIGRTLTAYMEMKDSGMIGGMISFFGGGLAVNAVREADANTNRLNAALDDCKPKFPNASHSLTFLNF